MSSDVGPSKRVEADPTGHRRVTNIDRADDDRTHDFLPRDEAAERFTLSTRLRTLRQTLRMSQSEFAEQHRFPLGALQLWENAEALPGEEDLARIIALEALHTRV